MAVKSYKKKVRLNDLESNLKNWLIEKGFDVQSCRTETTSLIQAKKSSALRSAFGGARTFSVLIMTSYSQTTIEIKVGKWIQNLEAVGVDTLVTGSLSLVGSDIAAGWTKKIESDLWEYLDRLISFSLEARKTESVKTNDDTKECPYCAETIKKGAIICRFCDRSLGNGLLEKDSINHSTYLNSEDFIKQGNQHLETKNNSDAITAFSNAIEKDDRCGEAYFFRAIAYKRLNERSKVVQDLKKSACLGYSQAVKIMDKKHNTGRLGHPDLLSYCHKNGLVLTTQNMKCPQCASLILISEKCVYCKKHISIEEQNFARYISAISYVIENNLRYPEIRIGK
jgi:hypothetical protein